MTRSPEPSRSCTKSLLSVISFSFAFFVSLFSPMYFISVLLHSIRMHICRCCCAVCLIVCIRRNCRSECECEYFMYIECCRSVRECVSWRCVCVYACKSAKHGCITCAFLCIPQQRPTTAAAANIEQSGIEKESARCIQYEALSLTERYDRATIQLHLFYRGGATVVLVQ